MYWPKFAEMCELRSDVEVELLGHARRVDVAEIEDRILVVVKGREKLADDDRAPVRRLPTDDELVQIDAEVVESLRDRFVLGRRPGRWSPRRPPRRKLSLRV